MQSAYLLVSHGSRDPRPQLAMAQLVELLYQRQSAESIGALSLCRPQECGKINRKPLVGMACLELASKPLHEQIKEFSSRAIASGYSCVQVVPLFLLSGVHVMEDIPAEVEMAKLALGQELKIDLLPHLGTHPGLSHLLASQLDFTVDAWILLAHGSRRANSKQPVEAIATQLGSQAADREVRTGVVVSAYWAVPPRLESRVKELVSVGHRQIGILPYFLFAGGITDAIARSVEQLKVQFPDALFQLAEPIGATAELADLIWDLIRK